MKKIILTLIAFTAMQFATAQNRNANTDSQSTGQSPANTVSIREADNSQRTSGSVPRQTVTKGAGMTQNAGTNTKNDNNTSPSLSGNNRSAGNLSSEKNTVSDPTGTGTRDNTSGDVNGTTQGTISTNRP